MHGGDTWAWVCGLAVTAGAVTALGASVTALHHVLTTWM